MNNSPNQKTKVKTILIEEKGKKGCWRVPAESETVDRAPPKETGEGRALQLSCCVYQ